MKSTNWTGPKSLLIMHRDAELEFLRNITARDASRLDFAVDHFGGLLEQETSGNFWALTTLLCAYS
jgi:hypothetical protein